LDDPLKPDEAASDAERTRVNNWYGDTLISRTNQKHNDRIIVVMQRLHEDDLCGYLQEKDQEKRWSQLVLPARAMEDQSVPTGPGSAYHRRTHEVLDAEREPEAVLKQIERDQGSRIFAAQYQQDPVPGTGNLVDITGFRTYNSSPPCSDYGLNTVQSWDTASKVNDTNDFSVCTTWHTWGRDAYLLDVFRDRLDYPRLREMIGILANRFSARTLLIEDSSAGTQVLQDLLQRPIPGVVRPISVPVKGDKKMRFEMHAAQIEAGHLLLPEDAPWKATYLKEIAAFPRGKYDDQVDSTAQFLAWFRRPDRDHSAGGMPRLPY
jgi:predicted phage terminase large subunit-like protein